MTTIETGDFRGPMTIAHSREIHGAVRGPVTVKADACLVVKGSLTGPLHIETGGIVTVFGAFWDTDQLTNHGMLMIAGTTDHVFCADSGMIAVAAGTLIMDRDRPEVVRIDGTCEGVATSAEEISININTEADDYVAYDSAIGMFKPLPRAS